MRRKSNVDYRKIYEQHYGPIPKEENGRTYEVHHIDGNHENNDPSNLVAITLQEHYDIHYRQGDFAACKLMKLQRMSKTPEEIFELSSKHAISMFAKGGHPFQDREWASERSKKSVENGTHPFLGGEIQRQSNAQRIEDGVHHFLSGDCAREYQKSVVATGKHCFQDTEWQKNQQNKLVENGTHHLLGKDSPTQVEWSCEYCGKLGKGKSNYQRWHGENCKLFSPLFTQSS